MSQYVIDRPGTTLHLPKSTFDRALRQLHGLLERHSISFLRISLGLVFLGFGVLKFFPGLSPAEDIAAATIDRLTFGLVGGHQAVLLTAVLESFIGLTLVTGKFVRIGLVVLTGALVGIMSPLILFTDQLFPKGRPSWASTSSRTSSWPPARWSSPPMPSGPVSRPTRTDPDCRMPLSTTRRGTSPATGSRTASPPPPTCAVTSPPTSAPMRSAPSTR